MTDFGYTGPADDAEYDRGRDEAYRRTHDRRLPDHLSPAAARAYVRAHKAKNWYDLGLLEYLTEYAGWHGGERENPVEARDFDTIGDAIDRAASKFSATYVLDNHLSKMPQVFSPSGGGYLMRELYSAKGRYHWPRQGVRVKKLPEAAKPLVPRGAQENPARRRSRSKKKFWEDLPPEEQNRLRALRRQELEAIGAMAFPVEGTFMGDQVTVFGPAHRFSPYDDPAYGAPTLSSNMWLLLAYPDGKKTITHAQGVHVGKKALLTPVPSCRDWKFGMMVKHPHRADEADLFGWNGSPYAQENPSGGGSQRDFVEQARRELTDRYEASNLAAQGITLGQYISANLTYAIRNIRNRAERSSWPEELSWSKEEAGEARRGPACGPDVQKAGWVHRGGCHPARPICRVARREKGLCHCEAYPHPHRLGGGLCVYGPEGSARFERLVHGPERELEPEPEPEPISEDEDFGSWVRRNPVGRRKSRGVVLRLDDWYTTKDYGDPYEAPERKAPLVVGVRSSDGEKIITSQIIEAKGTRIVTKTGSVYELGRPDRGFLEHLKKIGHKFDPRRPIVLHASPLNGGRENPAEENQYEEMKRAARFWADAQGWEYFEMGAGPIPVSGPGLRLPPGLWQFYVVKRKGAQPVMVRVPHAELVRGVQENPVRRRRREYEPGVPDISRRREFEMDQRIRQRTAAIVVGKKYFLSSFWDRDGAWVKVLSKSTDVNRAGWPSSVTFEVIEPVGFPDHKKGEVGTVNAMNLYERREDASHAARFSRENPADENGIPWVKTERDPKLHEELIEIQHEVGPIKNARDVYNLLQPWTSKQDQEHLLCVLLDIHSELRGVALIHKGARDRVSVDPADVLKPAIDRGAKGICIVHNHPSGSAEHSKADADLTKAVRDACDTVDIAFVDHIVLGMGEFYSFTDKKLTRVKSR